jgi:hypothetical protein
MESRRIGIGRPRLIGSLWRIFNERFGVRGASKHPVQQG